MVVIFKSEGIHFVLPRNSAETDLSTSQNLLVEIPRREQTIDTDVLTISNTASLGLCVICVNKRCVIMLYHYLGYVMVTASLLTCPCILSVVHEELLVNNPAKSKHL